MKPANASKRVAYFPNRYPVRLFFVASALAAASGCGLILGVGGETIPPSTDAGDAGQDVTVVPPGDAGEAGQDVTVVPPGDAAPDQGPADTSSGEVDAPPPPFSLTTSAAQVNVVRGNRAQLTVTVNRGAATGAAIVDVAGLPSGVTAEPLIIPAGSLQGVLWVDATAVATLGPAPVLLSANGGPGQAVTLLVEDAPGSLDSTFGDAGTVLLKGFDNLTNDGVVVGADGSVFVSGNIWLQNGCGGVGCTAIVLAKLNGSGKVDTTFGNQGISTQNGNAPYADAVPLFVIVPPAGAQRSSLLLGGFSSTPSYHSLLGAAFTSDGRADTSFGAGGYYVRDFGADSKAQTALLQPDGKLILAGFAGSSGMLVRLTSSGTLDPSFGDAGFVSTAGSVFGIGRLSTGSLVVGENWPLPGTNLASYSADGAQDTHFGDGGVVIGPPWASGWANLSGGWASLAVQADDRVVVSAAAPVPSDAGTGDAGSTEAIELSRFLADGTPDPQFGDAGTSTIVFPGAGAVANAMQLTADGRIVMAISRADVAGSVAVRSIVAARFMPNGVPDPTFAGSGFAVAAVEAPDAPYGEGIAVDAYGRIIVAGMTQDPFDSTVIEVLVARYWP